jgi:hypothetical protein
MTDSEEKPLIDIIIENDEMPKINIIDNNETQYKQTSDPKMTYSKMSYKDNIIHRIINKKGYLEKYSNEGVFTHEKEFIDPKMSYIDIIIPSIIINVKDFLKEYPSGGVFGHRKEISDIVVKKLDCKCIRTCEYTCVYYLKN